MKQSLDEQELFDYELREGQRDPSQRVVTAIDGGVAGSGNEPSKERVRQAVTFATDKVGGSGDEGRMERRDEEEAIMKTVKIEQMQTYV